jgi:hypothetical protein
MSDLKRSANMKSVFLVTHCYERSSGEEELKIIGVYRTKDEARLAVRRKKRYEGFKDYPKAFEISEMELGRDQWSEGFITYYHPQRKKTKTPNQALQTTTRTVTDRAPSSTLRASASRV